MAEGKTFGLVLVGAAAAGALLYTINKKSGGNGGDGGDGEPPPGGAEIQLQPWFYVLSVNGKPIIQEQDGSYALAEPIEMATLQGVDVKFRYTGFPNIEVAPDYSSFDGRVQYWVGGVGFQGGTPRGGYPITPTMAIKGVWVYGAYAAGVYHGYLQFHFMPYGQNIGSCIIKNMVNILNPGDNTP
jgi:hypothetical protein